jgi:hypothetical protein
VKPGKTLFLEEPDMHTVETLDRTGWHDVSMRVLPVVAPRGSRASGRSVGDDPKKLFVGPMTIGVVAQRSS